MKKIFRIVIILLLATFVVIQFSQPKKNLGDISENHIFQMEAIPENIKTILKNSCLDCHSNQTTYLWYHKIAPVSWMINHHVVDGKKELNFSNWEDMDIFDKITKLEEMCKETERKKMPLKPYVIMHPKAKLSAEDIIEICNWSEKLSLEMLEAIKE